MQRDVLRADARALAAVGAAGGHVEGPDDVEHVLLERVGGGLVARAGVRVVEDALFAAARRTDVAAGVAADAAGQLAAPEAVALLGRHFFELLHLGEAARVLLLALLADELVEHDELMALADCAALQQCVLFGDRLFAVQGLGDEALALLAHGRHALAAGGLDFLDVAGAVALDADDVHVFAQDAVLLEQLLERIRVARLQERRDLAALAGLGDQVFREVRAGKDAEHEVLLNLLRGAEHGGGEIVEEFAGLPAEHAVDRTVLQELYGFFLQSLLHLRSSSLRFGPSLVTVCTNSFIVAANFPPSAAETHSTRVRSFSMPR